MALPISNTADPQTFFHPATKGQVGERTVRILSYAILAANVSSSAYLFFLAVQQDQWHLYALAIIELLCAATVGLTFTPYIRKLQTRVFILEASVQVSTIALAVIISGVWMPNALIGLILSIILASITLTGRDAETGFMVAIITASVAAIAGAFSPFEQINLPIIQNVIPTILGILLMVYVALLAQESISSTLRIKLITASLAITVIPLILLSLILNSFTRLALQGQVNQSLKLAASETGSKVDDFLRTNRDSISSDAQLSVFASYLGIAPENRRNSRAEQDMRLTVDSLQRSRKSDYLITYGLLNSNGINIFDTNPSLVGSYEAGESYFFSAVKTGQVYVSEIQFSENGDPYIYFSSPVRDANQRTIGVLRAGYDALVLQRMLERNTSLLGARSYPVLVDSNLVRLADTVTPSLVYKSIAPLSEDVMTQLRTNRQIPVLPSEDLSTNLTDLASALQKLDRQPYFNTAFNPADPGTQQVGAAVRLSIKPWVMMYIEEQATITTLLQNQTRLATFLATLIAGLIAVLSTLIARLLADPITNLTTTAGQIAAGDLNATAKIESNDEIGSLGNAFNIMTARLRTFINELEDRVRERTQELAHRNDFLSYRTNQLQTVSDVARSIASAQELEKLLRNVTELISERFNYYHVGIFLVDENREFAVLRAANSEGGQRMLNRQHKLRVGQVGIVGYVTGQGQPRIATDVGQDAVFFNNPDLPQTRSEMALPLKSGDEIIGALDVQSTTSNAFTEEDVSLFGILADQVAIAIVNNRLYEETSRALLETQTLYRRYLRQEWDRELTETSRSGFRYTPQGIQEKPIDEISLPEVSGATVVGSAVSVPISLRGESIGVIHVEEATNVNREWAPEELETIQSVADQVGLALENARLFEQTVRRAERERKVLEITGKIRSTNDPQQMLQIALSELQRTLNVSRAQIILKKPEEAEPPASAHNGNGNGHSPNGSSEKKSS